MKPNELRIGNLLQQGEVTRVLEGAARVKYGPNDADRYSIVHCEHLEPIPITDGWLTSLGFRKAIWKDAGVVIDEVWEHENEYMPLLDMKLAIDYVGSKPLQYVHQLQNLFFALTGEELELKETA